MKGVIRTVWLCMLLLYGALYAKTVVIDRAEIIAGLKKHGAIYISNFGPEVRRDKMLVLTAVKTHGTALEFVDKSMQDDKEVVLASVRNDGNTLKYASPRLKRDKEVVHAAVENNPYTLRYADKSLRENKQFLFEIEQKRAKKLKKLNPPIHKTAPKKDKRVKRICWKYDINAFLSKPAKKIQAVYIWKKNWKQKSPKLMAVVVKMQKKIYRHNFIACHHAKKNEYHCGGECDSGQLKIDGKMHLKLDFLSFNHDDSREGVVTDLELSQQAPDSWLSPQKVLCPEYVIEGRYVCYDKKVITYKIGYEGCTRSKVSCGSIGKRHFGHYGSDSAAEYAYYRCEQNRPNQP